MNKRRIVSIVNFIRAVEPRTSVDLMEPVLHQIELMKKYSLRGTFLVQYDTLLESRFTELLKTLDPAQFELGVWFETVQPQVEKAGYTWTGRFPWDWHAHCGFSVGYTKEQREVLADLQFEKFREVFGYYPRVFGSWLFDSHTVRYLSDKYGLDAVLSCKEQYGTDGYTLWGGYYGQAYYPSRTNVFMPARSGEEQLPAPIFRMLGSDPVYQYDFGMDAETGAQKVQGVITLEPVYNGGGGGVPEWVDWFMKENYNGDCLSFCYAQAGQENSFGWESMKGGLEYQFPLFGKLQGEGKIEVVPAGEVGRWFKETYKATPASAITAHTAFDDPEKSSVWYSTKAYRANFFDDHGVFRIRDLHVFDEKFPDPFEETVCTENFAVYETLPLADGNRHSGNGVVAGLWLTKDGAPMMVGKLTFEDAGNGKMRLDYGNFKVLAEETKLTLKAEDDFTLENRLGRKDDHLPSVVEMTGKSLTLSYQGAKYRVILTKGRFETPTKISSEDGEIKATFENL